MKLNLCARETHPTNNATSASNATKSLRKWYATVVRAFRISPAQFAAGAAAYYSTPFLVGCTCPSYVGYLTTLRRIVRDQTSRLNRVDVHGSMHDVTYVLRGARIHVRTLAMMGS